MSDALHAGDPDAAHGPAGARPYDALLLLSFGGPEGPDDVVPFLENVTRGRGIPRERLVEVGEHYFLFGGVSPINAQCRALLDALRKDFAEQGLDLPVYWGNRNWAPYLTDTLREMARDGRRRVLTFVTSAYASYSGCRQYRENLGEALAALEAEGVRPPRVDKLRHFFNHPGFVEPVTDGVVTALEALPARVREGAHLAFTTHSIPTAAADTSGPPGQHGAGGAYVAQHLDAARLVASAVAERTGIERPWRLVYQSRSGPPAVALFGSGVLTLCSYATLRRIEARAARLTPGGYMAAGDPPSATSAPVPVAGILRARGVPAGIFASLAVLSTTDVLTAYLPVVGEERGIAPGVVGLLLSLRAAASVLSRAVLARMTAWLGRQLLLVLTCLAAGALCALLALPLPVWALAPVLVLLGFCLGAGQPLTMSTVVQAAPRRARSTALALRLTGNRLGQVAAPACAGLLAGAGGAAAPFVLLGAVLVGASGTAARVRARTYGTGPGQTAERRDGHGGGRSSGHGSHPDAPRDRHRDGRGDGDRGGTAAAAAHGESRGRG